MKIYTKTNFFLVEMQQKSWISCIFQLLSTDSDEQVIGQGIIV